MLVLSRKLSESIVIDENIHVQVLSIQGNRVRLGITAPRGVSIIRSEIEMQTAGADAMHRVPEFAGQA